MRCILVYLLLAGFAYAGAESTGTDGAPGKVWGAVYVPSEAFNAPQMWKNFSLAETRRDFGYARELHLNTLRQWASYEYWQMEPAHFKASFDQLLGAANEAGLKIFVSLFEQNGAQPTPANMWSTDPAKAACICSPSAEVYGAAHPERWEKPREFLRWFMENYRNDGRLAGIEVVNEPRANQMLPFAKAMFTTAKSMKGSVPLTIGSENPKEAEEFIPLGLDIITYHPNFPRDAAMFEKQIEAGLALERKAGLPVWITEWQRTRPSGPGWSKARLPEAETLPDYASLAPIVRKYPVGSFFWSLMVKRAYLAAQRVQGTVNGVFWPDGAVWSLADARAIANDPGLELKERKRLPEGFLSYLGK
jgi:hypothetical protein